MSKNDSQREQYQIVFKETTIDADTGVESTHIVKVPATEEEFTNYYRPINTYRKRMQEHGRCLCPKSKRLLCNMDCLTCEYRTYGDLLSLNDTESDEDGNETDFESLLKDDFSDTEDLVINREIVKEMAEILKSLAPEARTICELLMEGKSERDIAESMGKRQSTVNYKKKKIFEFLRVALRDFREI